MYSNASVWLSDWDNHWLLEGNPLRKVPLDDSNHGAGNLQTKRHIDRYFLSLKLGLIWLKTF